MTEVFTVFAQVTGPKGAHPGSAVEGRYIVENGVVTLTNYDGMPVRDEYGKFYEHTLAAGDIPKQIAARLTKKFRLRLRGKDGGRSGFEHGPLRYPKIKVV
jgi:hypothetical protein